MFKFNKLSLAKIALQSWELDCHAMQQNVFWRSELLQSVLVPIHARSAMALHWRLSEKHYLSQVWYWIIGATWAKKSITHNQSTYLNNQVALAWINISDNDVLCQLTRPHHRFLQLWRSTPQSTSFSHGKEPQRVYQHTSARFEPATPAAASLTLIEPWLKNCVCIIQVVSDSTMQPARMHW